jgi:hypothetical protein
MRDWLNRTQDWTPLQHIEVLSADRTSALLRAGADPHAGSPSPLELAKDLPASEATALVKRAAFWSPESHALFPAEARERAVEFLRIGYLLAWSPRYAGESGSLLDTWRRDILPRIMRDARKETPLLLAASSTDCP